MRGVRVKRKRTTVLDGDERDDKVGGRIKLFIWAPSFLIQYMFFASNFLLLCVFSSSSSFILSLSLSLSLSIYIYILFFLLPHEACDLEIKGLAWLAIGRPAFGLFFVYYICNIPKQFFKIGIIFFWFHIVLISVFFILF